MKIAILTRPLYNNYGGILQNYALQKYLQSLGHSSTTINYDLLIIPWYFRFLIGIKRFILKYIFKKGNISKIDPQKEGYEQYLRYESDIIHFIEKYIHNQMGKWPLTPQFVYKNPYEAYIVGSDQVWRADYTAHLYNYFLDFVKDPQIKKIAYAASFGVDTLNPKQYNIKKIAHLLRQFKAISVREKTGVALCKEVLGCDAEHVLDPTLLLTPDDYVKYLHLKQESPQYLVAYILDDTPHKQHIIKQIAQRYQLPIRYIGRHGNRTSPSIESWLEGIMNAKFVVTDSFHGSVFSILFEKEFITINNSVRGTSRFTSLFEMLGVNPLRMLESTAKQVPELAPINYSDIHQNLTKERIKAKEFLSKALN